MAIGYSYVGNPLNGSAIDDFILDVGQNNGGSNTINGDGGDDLILGDIGNALIPSSSFSNGTIGTALSFESFGDLFTIDENPMFASSSTPHASAFVEATAGQSEWFAVQVTAGETVTVDIDFGSNSPIGTSVDTVAFIRDGGGNQLATNDDGAIASGGAGSTSTLDSYLTFVAPSTGVYYIEIRKFLSGNSAGTTFTGGETFVLNVSVTNHAVFTPTVTGADVITGGTGNDTIYGVAGDDTIIWAAGDGSDTINGGSGSDRLDLTGSTSGWTVDLRAGTGSNGSDTFILASVEKLDGTNFADVLRSSGGGSVINALGGNDLVYAVSGTPETLDGGSGIDTIDTTDFNSLNSAYTLNMVTGATNFSESYTNFENLVSGDTADTVTGTIAINKITTNGGNDNIHAGDSADIVMAGDGTDALYGEAGNDKLYGGAGEDILDGGTGVDVMTGGDDNDTYYVDSAQDRAVEASLGGYDTVYSTAAIYALNASVEALILSGVGSIDGKGNSGDNAITGNSGANVLTGLDGSDTLIGNAGNDILNGGRNADAMTGGADNDTYYVDNVGDTVTELVGGGTDRVSASIDHTLAVNVENLVMTGLSRVGTGNAGINVITGSDGNDTISGLAGADTLQGGLGNDTISGGSENDIIYGDAGRDTLTGDAGADRFTFREGDTGSTNATADRITDFVHGSDKIVLSIIDGNANTAPNDAFSWVGTAAFSGTAGELRYQLIGGDTYVQGDTNGDSVADLVIRLTNTIPLTATDFVL